MQYFFGSRIHFFTIICINDCQCVTGIYSISIFLL